MKAGSPDASRDLASACNKLSAGNFDRIYVRVHACIVADPEPLLAALFEHGAGAGTFGDLYVRMFGRMHGGMAEPIEGALSRASSKFHEQGGVVMAFVDVDPERYDEFCGNVKSRALRLATLAMLLRLGNAIRGLELSPDPARSVMEAFEIHVCSVQTPGEPVQLDLVVDGLGVVVDCRPDLRREAQAMATRALLGPAALDARTRFKLMDVRESASERGRTSRRRT